MESLIADAAMARSVLSEACLRYYEGGKGSTSVIRQLDVIAYGAELGKRGAGVQELLAGLGPGVGEVQG